MTHKTRILFCAALLLFASSWLLARQPDGTRLPGIWGNGTYGQTCYCPATYYPAYFNCWCDLL